MSGGRHATGAAGPGRPQVMLNAAARAQVPGASRAREPLAVHRRLPGYAPTPLASCPEIAAELGVRAVWAKDETWRLGLPAFKMLGASYATYRALTERLGHEVTWAGVDDLRTELAALGPMALAAATDGNHGRAVARMARLLGLSAAIYVPEGTVAARIRAIESEGAAVSVVAGDYDAAVRRSAQDASDTCLVVSDTSWPGYTRIPGWVVDGYSTIFAEVADQLSAAGAGEPDLVVIPVGVGALAAAAVHHFKAGGLARTPFLLGVEPSSASCVLASLRAGRLVTVPGPHPSIMVGLNCGTPSQIAWPLLAAGMDAMVAVDDDWARRAMRALAAAGIVAGETGAAGLGGLFAVCETDPGALVRDACQLGPDTSVLLLCTEGATDEAAWEQIVGRPVPGSAHPQPDLA
ncbi:MAG TPA: diaminopropionate ammonia-lyase [Streptosporangiaceae bacterium]|nr:diaminopropionate ammonia-lyase [Streptosporangiaceae bacterium]